MQHGLILDGIFASQTIDTSGEELDIAGCDISSIKAGEGVLNVEHVNPGIKTEQEGKGTSTFNTIIGHIIYVKKIYKESDCSNKRERMYWEKVKVPFIYGQVELFDQEKHPGAMAAAAMIRYYAKRKMPVLIRFSIEGHTLKKEGNRIVRSMARAVAATIKPCNRSAVSSVLEDPEIKVPEKPILKSELGSYESEFSLFTVSGISELKKNLETLQSLKKTLTAGGGEGVAPGSQVGFSSLVKEDLEKKKKFYKSQIQAAVRDWDGNGSFKDFVKNRLPEADPEFFDHFDELSDDLDLKGIKIKKNLDSILSNLKSLKKN